MSRRAISCFMREAGIATVSWSALLAFRIRVSMSATGSVIIVASPTRLRHAGDGALVGQLAQADPAQAELLVDRARPAAAVAPAVGARLELLRPGCLRDETLLCHVLLLLLRLRPERQAQLAQERQRLV